MTATDTTTERVARYRSMLTVAVLLVGIGILIDSEALVIASLLPLLFVMQSVFATGRDLTETLQIERTITPAVALPGQSIEVTTTVTNVGDRPITDLRFADRPPAELGVIDGSPQGSGVLRQGQSVSISYSVAANRGQYEFSPVTVQTRNISGTIRSWAELSVTGETSVEARVAVDDIPFQQETTALAGTVAVDQGGSGIEFYATREYRPGDPIKRVDWRQYAKEGELSTIQFRDQRAARVAIIIDSRDAAHITTDESLPTGATLCAYAATLGIGVLHSDGHRVGVGALGIADPSRGTWPAWVAPDEQTPFAARAAAICNAAASGTEEAPTMDPEAIADGGGRTLSIQQERLLSNLSADSQVLLCSPVLDEEIVTVVESFVTEGHTTTILSPQITDETVTGRLTAIERAERLERLRGLGATVVNWGRDEALPLALNRAIDGGFR